MFEVERERRLPNSQRIFALIRNKNFEFFSLFRIYYIKSYLNHYFVHSKDTLRMVDYHDLQVVFFYLSKQKRTITITVQLFYKNIRDRDQFKGESVTNVAYLLLFA